MDVRQLNQFLGEGIIDRDDMWPRIIEYESKAAVFRFEFGLNELPLEPGLIVIRGPRQYGKSTWLDLELRHSAHQFGKATSYYLNGDDFGSKEELENAIVALEASFKKQSKIKRLFIDEITAVEDWETVIKRLWDRGHLRDVLIVTTGSKAFDLRRGSERLPGRKGKLSRTDYIFLPISYQQFHENCSGDFGEKTWLAYLITGGSPILCNDIYQFERLPESSIQIIRDWIFGTIVESGRSRIFFHNVLQSLFKYAGTPVGFAKLARESGVANNTVVSGYMEQLADLLTVLPSWQWDSGRKILMANKPCKFQFMNLAAVVALHPSSIRYLHEFEVLSNETKGVWLEWLIAQEIWRRTCLESPAVDAERLGFWKSANHEIDFVTHDQVLIEVKWGTTGPLDFSWFSKSFPGSQLLVISQSQFQTKQVRGITPHEFLLNGWKLTHPF
jgi:predicted AAA+ superfamily ATPase